jgi:hypothetical protein
MEAEIRSLHLGSGESHAASGTLPIASARRIVAIMREERAKLVTIHDDGRKTYPATIHDIKILSR